MTRILDTYGSDLADLTGAALVEAIRASEGRTVLAKIVSSSPPLLAGTSNAELVAAFGADLVCLNLVDPSMDGTLVTGLERLDPPPDGFSGLARLLGRPVGLNLEPPLESVPAEFRCDERNLRAAAESGAAFVMVTANPGRDVSTADVGHAVETVRSSTPEILCLAGKMHAAGYEERLDADAARALIESGAQGVLVPVPGTVPGIDHAAAAAMVAAARDAGALAVGVIGTSQEGADAATVASLALEAKRAGVDIHHIGDAGYSGIADPANIYSYSVAIRGKRHTWNRMARGVRASWKGG